MLAIQSSDIIQDFTTILGQEKARVTRVEHLCELVLHTTQSIIIGQQVVQALDLVREFVFISAELASLTKYVDR